MSKKLFYFSNFSTNSSLPKPIAIGSKKETTILPLFFVILFLGLIPCGCNNDPTSPEEGHADADGFVLEDESGNQIYRELKGATTGSVTISVGQSMECSPERA